MASQSEAGFGRPQKLSLPARAEEMDGGPRQQSSRLRLHASWPDRSISLLSSKAESAPASTEAETAAALGLGVSGSSSSRITGLSVYDQETACYSGREPSRIPRVPWLSPTPLSNLDCFGPILLPLVSGAGLSTSCRAASAFRSPLVGIPQREIGPKISSRDGKSSFASSSHLVESLLRPAIPTTD
jgi:hypothetical protein